MQDSEKELPEWAKEEATKTGPRPKYPLRTMGLGEVFAIPSDRAKSVKYHNFKIYLHNRGRMLDRKFMSRQLEDGTIEVCRVK